MIRYQAESFDLTFECRDTQIDILAVFYFDRLICRIFFSFGDVDRDRCIGIDRFHRFHADHDAFADGIRELFNKTDVLDAVLVCPVFDRRSLRFIKLRQFDRRDQFA